jgi:glycine oxidase
VELRVHASVARIELDRAGTRVTGVSLQDGELVCAHHVVIAAGAWSGSLEGLPSEACVPVRPVKGQILRLRDPAGPGLLRRVVRFEGGYLVPRADGRYVLGATVEERGFEEQATAGGVYELLREAHELLPGVSELQIEELCVGLLAITATASCWLRSPPSWCSRRCSASKPLATCHSPLAIHRASRCFPR